MDRQFYRSILLLVNQKDSYEMLQSYVDKRIEISRIQLETCMDEHKIRMLQGQIAELKRFRTLRDEVVKGAE
jgi:hypothetical protein